MNSYDENRQYYVVTDANGVQSYQDVAIEDTNKWLEEQKAAGNKVDPEQYLKFRGDQGEDYAIPSSKAKGWGREMEASGRGFAPIVEMENPMTGEKRSFANWGDRALTEGVASGAALQPSRMGEAGFTRADQAKSFIQSDAIDYQAAVRTGWKPTVKAAPEAGALDVVKGILKPEAWTEADWDPAKMAATAGTAVVSGLVGAEKSAVGMVADVGAVASEALGGTGESWRAAKRFNEQMMDTTGLKAKVADAVGMDAEERAALDTAAGIGEEVGGIYGIGAAGSVVGKGLKAVGTGMKAINQQAFAKAIEAAGKAGQTSAGTTLAMGASGYESIYDDETLRPLLESEDPGDVARAKIIGAVKAGANAFGGKVINGIINRGAVPTAAVKKQLSKKLAELAGGMVKGGAEFAGFNELNLWSDAVARGALDVPGLTPEELLDRTVSEGVHGFMMGFGLGALGAVGRGAAGAARSAQVEGVRAAVDGMRKDYFTGLYKEAVEKAGEIRRDGMRTVGEIAARTERNQKAAQEAAAAEIMASAQGKMPGSGQVDLGSFSYVTREGVRVSFDNGLVREGADGQAEVVVGGVVLDRGGENVKGVTADPTSAAENARRAIMLGQGIRTGMAKGERVALPDVGDYQAGAGSETDARPVIMLRNEDGSLSVVTGRGRCAAAKARGESEITAVVLEAKDGWNADNVGVFNTVENLMDGKVDAAGCVKAFEDLGWNREQLTEAGLVKSPAAKAALKVCERGFEPLRKAVAEGEVPVHVAEQVAERVNSDTMAGSAEQVAAVQEELGKRIGMATRTEARAVCEQVRRILDERGAEGIVAEKVVDEAVRRARGEELEQRAEEHGQKKEDEQTIEATPVEDADGKLTTVGELERENEVAREAAAEGTQEEEIAASTSKVGEYQARQHTESKSLNLKRQYDGSLVIPEYPEVRADLDHVEKSLTIRGFKREDFAAGSGYEKISRTLGELIDACASNGIRVKIDKELSREVVDALDFYEENIRVDPVIEAKSNLFMRRLEASGLAKGVVTDQEAFEEALRKNSPNGERFVIDGMTYGFTDGENVYLNPKFFGTMAGLKTQLHEFGHLGIVACKRVNRVVYDRGMDMIAETDYYRMVKDHADYADLSEVGKREEALTRMIADRGAALESAPKSVAAALKQWLVDFWNSFGEALGLRKLTPEQAASMTIEQVADAIRAEMLSGRKFEPQKNEVLKDYWKKRTPQNYMDSGAGRVSPAFEFWANNTQRIMNVPKKGDFGWDIYNQLVNGTTGNDRVRMKRILCGDRPKVAGENGAASNDLILEQFNRKYGEGNFTTEQDFEQLVYDFLDNYEKFDAWRKGGAWTAEELAWREAEAQEAWSTFKPDELEAAGVPTDGETEMLFNRRIEYGEDWRKRLLSSVEFVDGEENRGQVPELKAGNVGGVRVTKAGAEGYGGAGFAGRAAAEELGMAYDPIMNEGMSFDMPTLVKLYKDITGAPGFPELVRAFAGQKWMGKVRTSNGKLLLTRDMFGIVDDTDQARIKTEMKNEGYFQHETQEGLLALAARGVDADAEAERSEKELANRLQKLGDDRIASRDMGGNTAPKIVLAHEIGHIVCDLPKRSNMGPLFDGMQTVGHGLVNKFQEWESKYEWGALRNEALSFIAKWRGTGTLPAEAEKYFQKKPREIYAECYGAFLSAPMTLKREAPTVYAEMLDTLDKNAALQQAWNRMQDARRQGPEGSLKLVHDAWKKQRKFTAQVDARNLERDLRTEPGTWGERLKRKWFYVVDGMQGPVFVTLTSAEKAEYKRIQREFEAKMENATTPEEKNNIIEQKMWAEDNIRQKVLGVKAAVLGQQRGGGGVDHIFLQDVVGDVLQRLEKAGIDRDSFDWYLALKKNVMYRGKADVAGLDPRLAQKGLDDMRARDPEKFAELEACAQMFHAVCQREVLDCPEVVEAMGRTCIDAWKQRAAYVTTKRILSADEVEAVAAWNAEHPDKRMDMMDEFELMRKMHLGKSSGVGASGAVFKKAYEGSFQVTASESTATIEKMLQLKAFARRNHVMVALADFVKDFGVEGWKEIKPGDKFNGGGGYGRISFLRNGERRELVCPKTVAVAFENQGKLEHFPFIRQILWANTFFKQAVTVYAGSFGLTRNVRRNRVSSDQLNEWKRPTRMGQIVQAAGFGTEAQVAAHVFEVVSRRTGWLHGKGIDAIFGPATNIYWMNKATRCAKMALQPGGFRAAMDKAHELMRAGERQSAAELMDDIRVTRELLRMNVAASPFAINAGTADVVDLNALLKGTGWSAEIPWKEYPLLERFKTAKGFGGKIKALYDARLPIGLAVRQSPAGKLFDKTLGKMADFTRMEELRQKLIDFLAAERCNAERQAAIDAAPDAAARDKLPKVMSKNYLATKIAMNSGSPAAEARGPMMTLAETFIPFSTAAQKSARRNWTSMTDNPRDYFAKMAPAFVGRFNRNVLFLGGGIFAAIAAVRQMFQGDDEKQKKLDQVEQVARSMQRGMRNTSSYMASNYHVLPIHNFGPYCTLGLRVPMGDGEKMFSGFADWAAAEFCRAGSEHGLSPALMADYDAGNAVKKMLIGSGWLTDVGKVGGMVAFARDTVLAAIGNNPADTFAGGNVYPDDVFTTRFQTPEFTQMMLRKAFEDLGGGAVVQMGHIDDMGTVPPEAKTIFHVLHSVPFVSSIASGFLYMSCSGSERTAARIRSAGSDRKAVWSLAAKRLVEDMIDNGTDIPTDETIERIRRTYGLDDEEWEIVNTSAFKLQKQFIENHDCEDLPIHKAWKTVMKSEKSTSRLIKELNESKVVLGIDDL